MLLTDDLLEQLSSALTQDVVRGFDLDNDDIEATELDPVARISQQVAESASELPSAIATPDPFDSPLDIDRMTTTIAERRLAKQNYRKQTPGSSGSFQAAQAATGLGKPSTGKFVRRMLAKEGLPYEWGFTGQPDPESGKRAYDCSGIINRIMQNFGFNNFPRVSGDIIAHAKPISVKKALNTRGAVLWFDGHIAVSLGNGKTIEARGEDYGVMVVGAEENKGRFTKGGLLPELTLGGGGGKRKKPQPQMRVVTKSQPQESPSLQSVISPTAVFGGLMDQVEAPAIKLQKRQEDAGVGAKAGMKGVKGQLYAGFIEAGRPDLAKMVFTEAFDTWIGQESGWDKNVVSLANNKGMPNGGLFQFWQGHDWAKKYFKNGKFKASPFEQAIFAATHFDLTPDDIKRYAYEIRHGTYKGWG